MASRSGEGNLLLSSGGGQQRSQSGTLNYIQQPYKYSE
jgi:hypothetical protein